ncbi:hypothetical protein DFA_09604 [Cavenderia fasciculata]|uniref:Transmembrane protein n=1 Tax=Cavenderia fasciculata TaxID=261658 RepID=F4Q833_CACFS|nr:uncharacterized protein DFA_09604 [Cavenderia fasciculata]EGG15933.1 hypothetical protein DFA_09604 [Cavenderia fasciculata]|eukprot:XP_004352258.1 hypothetical protein DFA_09604 [Cavenderia fasciculata]
MKTILLVSILILLVNLLSFANAAPKAWVSTLDMASWFTPANWNPAAVPINTDQVTIAVPNSISYVTGNAAVAKTVTIGTTAGSNSSLLLLHSLSADMVTINYGSQLGASQANGQSFLVNDMSNYGVLSTEGLFDTSTLLKNFGIYFSSAVTGVWGLLNNGQVSINNYFYSQGRFTHYGFAEISVQNCQLDVVGVEGSTPVSSVFMDNTKATFNDVAYQSTADIYVGRSATFDMFDSNLTMTQPGVGYDIMLNFMQNTNSTISRSYISLQGALFFTSENASVIFSNTTLESFKTFAIDEDSRVLITNNSYFKFNDYFVSMNNGQLTISDQSTMVYQQAEFVMLNNSKIQVLDSQLLLSTVPGSTLKTIYGMFNNTVLTFDQKSQFILQGEFYQQNNSHVSILGESVFIVHDYFYMLDQSILSIDSSTITINGNLLPFNSSLVDINNSTVLVTGVVGFTNSSTFTATDSTITSQGAFAVGQNGGLIASSVLNVDSDMVSVSTERPLTIKNTVVTITGNLLSSGDISAIDNSKFTIVGGSIINNGVFTGQGISLDVQVGNIDTRGVGAFNCNGCKITIGLGDSNGTFITASDASVTLTSTTLLTNSNGTYVSNGGMHVSSDSNLSNMGLFLANSNILLTAGNTNANSFSNTGKFLVNAVDGTIQVPLLNLESGSIEIQQSSRLASLHQQSGDTLIASGSTVTLTDQILVSGGDLLADADSSIVGQVSVNGGLLTAGARSIIKGLVNINGGLVSGSDHSIEGTVNIPSGTLSGSSQSISGQVNVNGGLLDSINSTIVGGVSLNGTGNIAGSNNSIQGYLNIAGGVLSGSNHLIQGDILISGGLLSGTSHSIVGTVNIDGGNVTGSNTSIVGDVNVSGGLLAHINSTIVGNLTVSGGNVAASTPEDIYNRLFVDGTYAHGKDGTIQFVIDQSDNYHNQTQDQENTYMNVTKDIILSGGTLVIKVIEGSTTVNNITKTINLISANSATNITGSFDKIQIITYDPETGNEKEADQCKYKAKKSGSKFDLLVDPSGKCEESSSFPKGAIIGIVVGIVGAAAIAGVVIHFRNKIPKHLSIKYKLKQLEKSQTELGMTKP